MANMCIMQVTDLLNMIDVYLPTVYVEVLRVDKWVLSAYMAGQIPCLLDAAHEPLGR